MRRVLLLALALFASSCGGGHPAAGSGALEGAVFRAPATPTCVKGQSCSRRAPGVTLRFSRDASLVAHVKTRSDGTYRVSLPPGRYSVSGAHPVRPQSVRVRATDLQHVDFAIDTRIR
jgi:hypothetical protein